MSSYTFADRYKAAGLSPSHEIIALRQEPVKELAKDASLELIIGLTRLYFGLPVPDGVEWFRDAFQKTDTSFSLIDSAREVSILAACVLAEIIEASNSMAALAPLVAVVGGIRTPTASPEFLEEARQVLANHEVKSRQAHAPDIGVLKLPAKSTANDLVNAAVAANDWTKFGNAINLVSNESATANQNLVRQVRLIVSPMAAQVRDLREEVSMLWWYIGGWSQMLEKPFAEMEIGVAAIMAGLDLANLVEGDTGPVAAPAILHRMIVANRSKPPKKLALHVVVDAITPDMFSHLNLPENVPKVSDLCPILCALTKAKEIGNGSGWHAAFKKSTGLDATIELSPLNIAIQVYRESLLVNQVE